MSDYSELIERLEAWSDLDTESGHNSRAETMLRAATAIRDLIAERDAAIGALEFQGTWNEAIEAAARLIAADDSPVDWCDAYPAIRAMRKDTPQ